MKPFEFYNPVRIIFGAGEMDRLGAEASKYGKKALLVKTTGPLEKLGVYERATRLMEGAGMEVFPLDGVEPNPKLSSVRKGIEICKKHNIDILIAVGGGSAIDCAKAIALGAVDDGDVWDFFLKKRTAVKALPVGAVSTIAATGSESSVHSVITNEQTQQKYATHYDLSYPKFAILDPELHKSVPRFLTAAGMADTISHAIENYFAGDRNTPISDRLAEGIVMTVIENEGILDNLGDIEKRYNLSWAANLAINGLTDAGRGTFYYVAHTIEHQISAHFDVNHGAGLAVMLPAWFLHFCGKDPSKFAQFASRVFGIRQDGRTELEAAIEGIVKLKEKFRSWGLPVTLKELGIESGAIRKIAQDTVNDPDSPIPDIEEVVEILESCYTEA